jgi:aminoglycoside phosphotransferase (APT) family kinase protein
VTGRLDSRWAAIVAMVEPAGRLVRSWKPAGGLSTAMTVLEVAVAGGPPRRFVVRRPQGDQPRRPCLSIADEHRLLGRLHEHGLPVPRPRLLDLSGEILRTPYSVFDYVNGSPRVSTGEVQRTGQLFAAQLAAIHQLDARVVAGIALPQRADVVARDIAEMPEVVDDSLREGLIRDVLRTFGRTLDAGPYCLLHGDFWPGNVVWAGAAIAAVIDWEDACWGDPLADVATTRLDLLWAFGPEAMSAFTDRYLALTSADATHLPVWDLVAALRPAGSLSTWAADWAEFGRPDVTPATMRAAHTWFVDRALAALDVG